MKIIDKKKILDIIQKKNLGDFKKEILEEMDSESIKILQDKIKKIRNKKRIIDNDKLKEHELAKDVLSKEDIKLLPRWVRDDIENAQVIGKSKNVLKVSNGRKYHIKNNLNDLSGAEWTFFLNSVINTNYPTGGEDGYAHHIRKIHPSPKPPQLMKEIIEFFTKENEIVFDYFMGVGGTLLGSSLSKRRAIGIDLNNDFIQVYKKANKHLGLQEQVAIHGDSLDILDNKSSILDNHFKGEDISLILIDPPYGDMMSRKKTGQAVKKGRSSSTPFTSSKKDLGNMDWKNFLKAFHKSVVDSMKYLKNKGHIVVFIKDLQPDEESENLLHADIIKDLNQINDLNYLGTKIWADQNVSLYPYGYPFSYVSNQIHQYIMIFRKN